MWQTKYAAAIPKNLGLGLNFRPCSEHYFLSGSPQSVMQKLISRNFPNFLWCNVTTCCKPEMKIRLLGICVFKGRTIAGISKVYQKIMKYAFAIFSMLQFFLHYIFSFVYLMNASSSKQTVIMTKPLFNFQAIC